MKKSVPRPLTLHAYPGHPPHARPAVARRAQQPGGTGEAAGARRLLAPKITPRTSVGAFVGQRGRAATAERHRWSNPFPEPPGASSVWDTPRRELAHGQRCRLLGALTAVFN